MGQILLILDQEISQAESQIIINNNELLLDTLLE